jgi:acyl-CoA synthetase (AMP-forming)/AMP-acid ligase II
MTHPAIYDAMVVGKPDARLGELPVAAIAIRKGEKAPDADALRKFLRDLLPSTFIPTEYHALDAIPITPTNKPDLAGVKRLFAG